MQNKIEKKKILWEVGEAGSGLHFIKMRVECIKKNGGAKQGSCLAAHPANGGFAPGGESKKKGRRQSEHGAAKEQKSSILFAQTTLLHKKDGEYGTEFSKKE